eukprot:808638-Prymnesium_polylepis.1
MSGGPRINTQSRCRHSRRVRHAGDRDGGGSGAAAWCAPGAPPGRDGAVYTVAAASGAMRAEDPHAVMELE